MRILRFGITNAHRYLTVRVSFDPSLTFLTGINGSGKTTVVRGLAALLHPSFRALAQLRYDTMEVEIEHAGETVTVSASRDDSAFTLSVSKFDSRVIVPLFKSAPYEPPSRRGESEIEFYRHWRAQTQATDVMTFLEALPSPMVLDLERRSGEGGPSSAAATRSALSRRDPFSGTMGESLTEVDMLAESTYMQCVARRQELAEKLRRSLVMTAFLAGQRLAESEAVEMPAPPDAEQWESDRGLVVSTLISLGFPELEVHSAVDAFFEQLRVLTQAVGGKTIDEIVNSRNTDLMSAFSRWVAFRPIEQQIRAMVRDVQRYNVSAQDAFKTVTLFLDSVNKFLRESGKELAFNPRGQLRVRVGDRDIGSVWALSSGERQLVVLLTHLSLNTDARAANVLIIDEPELSLHIHWQEMFVDALLGVAGGLQVILATHSPSIIMDRIPRCVDLGTARQ